MSQDKDTTRRVDTTRAITTARDTDLARRQDIGQQANRAAAGSVFADYASRRADNTIRHQRADLATFADYLGTVGIDADPVALATTAAAWAGISWGLVDGFVKWLLLEGYAVGTVNVKLSSVKVYAGLAFKAGALDAETHAAIRTVKGYRRKEAIHLDERRADNLTATRLGNKKADPVTITAQDADALKGQDLDTPQGRRDAVLMALLLDHGLRCSEVAALDVTAFDLDAKQMTFYRPKVDIVQTHELSRDTVKALRAWFDSGDAPAAGPLLRGSRKGGQLTGAGLSPRAITHRVQTLGAAVGLDGLSAHDCRHHWATKHAREGVDPFRLQEAGGWASLVMPRRYVETARIANEGMV